MDDKIQILTFYLTDGETIVETKRFKGTKEQMKVTINTLQSKFCINEEPKIFEQKTKVKSQWYMKFTAQSNSKYSWHFDWPVNVEKPDFKNITL